MAEKKIKGIAEKLLAVQVNLKAPKSQYNSFGKYKYRNCEDILTAVKPLLFEQGLTLGITDEMVLIGDRYYVKATVKVTDGDMALEVIAYAREPLSKKGMDEAQVTGATSSYARKYALNGMFLIDDTQDSDSMDNTKKQEPKKQTTTASAKKPAPAVKKNEAVSSTLKKAGARSQLKKPSKDSGSMMEKRAAEMLETFLQATSTEQLLGLATEYKLEIGLMHKELQDYLRAEFAYLNTKLEESEQRGS